MLKAFKSIFQILIIGLLRLPYKIWSASKDKLINQYNRNENIYQMLDDEYIATNWLDWVVDCVIFLIYPFGLLIITLVIVFAEPDFPKFVILIALIPLYFSTLFISVVRELGGSFMLLHINVKKLKNI